MDFPQSTDEIVIPGSSPFAAGNNVLGIGTTLPPELAGAVDRTAALVWYTTQFNPLATTPQVKYWYITVGTGTGYSELVIGCGFVKNPSTSQVVVPVDVASVGMDITSGTDYGSYVEVDNVAGNTVAGMYENSGSTNHPGKVATFNGTATETQTGSIP